MSPGLKPGESFHSIGIVETKRAIEALGALAQETRLKVFRLLVQAGPAGMAAGRIAEKLDLPAATLSFHLAGLARAGLARSQQDGRFVIYSADFGHMNELVGFLTENCCGGQSCEATRKEAPAPARRRA